MNDSSLDVGGIDKTMASASILYLFQYTLQNVTRFIILPTTISRTLLATLYLPPKSPNSYINGCYPWLHVRITCIA